jgi:methionyl-tRNA formyltransferase
VFARATTPVDHKTLVQLWDELSATGSQLLVDWLPTAFVDGRLVDPEPQDGEVTYAAKLTVDDRRLDLDAPAERQLAVVRLGNAWTELPDGKRLKVLDARPGDGDTIEFLEVQPEGKRPMAYADWLRGTPAERRGGFT